MIHGSILFMFAQSFIWIPISIRFYSFGLTWCDSSISFFFVGWSDQGSILFMRPMYIICYNFPRIPPLIQSVCSALSLLRATHLTFQINGLQRETRENYINTNKSHEESLATKYLWSFVESSECGRERETVNRSNISVNVYVYGLTLKYSLRLQMHGEWLSFLIFILHLFPCRAIHASQIKEHHHHIAGCVLKCCRFGVVVVVVVSKAKFWKSLG